MSYPAVTIGSVSYNVYVDQADADTYLEAAMSSQGDAWRATTDDDTKARALVTATRWLDSVVWLGTKTDPTQDLQWPRTSIDGVAVDVLPGQLASACADLASYLVEDVDARADLNAPLLKDLKAGSASLTYFRPEGGVQVQTPFPPSVMPLVSQWLGGGSGVNGACSWGTDGKSQLLDRKYGFQHGI